MTRDEFWDRVLTPRLTPLDRRVLAEVQRPRRAVQVAQRIVPRPPNPESGWPESWERYRLAVDARLPEIEGILRGLERLGYVERTRNGWWRAR